MEGGREERRSLNRAFMNPISLSLVRMQMPTHKPTVQALGGSYPYFIFLFGIPYACTVQYKEILFISIKVTYWHRWTFCTSRRFLVMTSLVCLTVSLKILLLTLHYK